MLNKSAKLAVVFVLLAGLAAAQQGRVYSEGGSWRQEITGSLAGVKNLHVRVDAGTIRVQGGSRSDISYVIHNRAYTSSEDRARRELDAYKINAYTRGDTAWIVGEGQGKRANRCSVEIVIDVPREMESVKVETDGGGIVATGINGSVDAESGGGQVRMQDIGGSVRAQTGGDNIDVGSIGGDLMLETGGGRVSIGSVKGKINATTGGGDIVLVASQQGAILEAGGGNIKVKQCGGRLRISTGGGNIDVEDAGGAVEIETGGGSIRLGSAKGPVHAQTGAGRIELNGVPSAHAQTGTGAIVARFVGANGEHSDSMLETAMGDVTVYLVPNLNISVRASIDLANGHTIRSEFPEIRIMSEGGQWGPKTITADGTLNGGGALLKVNTTSGDISIRRAGR
jgi:DUF4097 and DUF4098 domain-containing protein YvlB